MQERKEKGVLVDERHIRKHKADVFRLILLLASDKVTVLPDSIKADMQLFVEKVKDLLPGPAVFKEMGAANIDVILLFNQLVKIFDLKAINP